MRRIVTLISLVFLFAAGISCTAVRESAQGRENESYLEFVGPSNKYKDGLTVQVDDNTPFNALVNKEGSRGPKRKLYAISPGRHLIQVSFNGQLLYKQEIFLSAQETRKINIQ